MTVAEITLLTAGRKDLIAEGRRYLHEQVADDTRSSVEKATGRTVLGAQSHVDFDRGIAALMFILSPARSHRQSATRP